MDCMECICVLVNHLIYLDRCKIFFFSEPCMLIESVETPQSLSGVDKVEDIGMKPGNLPSGA